MSSSHTAVAVRGLSKAYRIAAGRRVPTTLREAILAALKGVAVSNERTFWALDDVSFDVEQGEVLGVIGPNGAGKTTLLKILSRITEPTGGTAVVQGRVGSLLEVGTGFHPELTGRENIFLNGSILGMRRREIAERFEAIVDFAEVGPFLDTPVKRYSSGMYVRLAFAVAAHLNPEIMIVDEVLAVGDAAFQQRCLAKMDDVAHQGRTILFVSHNMGAIERLCHRVLLLERGRPAFLGGTAEGVRRYLGHSETPVLEWRRSATERPRGPHFVRAWLCDPEGRAGVLPNTADPFGVAVEFEIPDAVPDLLLAVAVTNETHVPLFATSPVDNGFECPRRPGRYKAVVVFPGSLFSPRQYHVVLSLYGRSGGYDHAPSALSFSVSEVASLYNSLPGGRIGELQVQCHWRTPEAIDPPPERVLEGARTDI